MSQTKIKIEDFIQVLRHHDIDVAIEEDEISVWKGNIKRTFPLDDGFIIKRFVHRTAQKFKIDIHYFFHPALLNPEDGEQ